jgi:hypothetical protein
VARPAVTKRGSSARLRATFVLSLVFCIVSMHALSPAGAEGRKARCASAARAEAVAVRQFPPGSRVTGRTHLDREGGARYWDVHVRKLDRTVWSAEVRYGTCRVRVERG